MEEKKLFTSIKYDNQGKGQPTSFSANDVDPFIIWCNENEVSDITIQNDEQIICDIYGKKHRVTNKRLSKTEVGNIIRYIYGSDRVFSILNSAVPIDIQWAVKLDSKNYLRCRVNMVSCGVKGDKAYSVSIRVIKDQCPSLESLNLHPEIINNLKRKNGLIIICGETGSGKSTLLASTIEWRLKDESSHLKIITLESPIEYIYDDVPKPTSSITQIEIKTHIEDFATGVSNSLRANPDVILIGEIRDRNTMEQALIAASTGHLVYTTAHSNGVADLMRQIVNRFNQEEKNARVIDLLSSINMIVAQMLVNSTDGKRIAIREHLVFNSQITDILIEAGIDNLTYETRKLLQKYGKTFLQDATEKFEKGLISEETLNEIKLLRA